jgi:hypothetical protein
MKPQPEWSWGEESGFPACHTDHLSTPSRTGKTDRLLVRKLGFWFKPDFWCKAGGAIGSEGKWPEVCRTDDGKIDTPHHAVGRVFPIPFLAPAIYGPRCPSNYLPSPRWFYSEADSAQKIGWMLKACIA